MTQAIPSIGQSQPYNEEPSPDPDEQTSLLPAQYSQNTSNADAESSAFTQYQNNPRRHIKTILLYAFFNLMADLGGSMTAGSEVRLLENAVCRELYRKHDPSVIGPPPFAFVDESLCKNQIIQSRLAQLSSIQKTWSIIPGLVLTIFSGSLPDMYGRKPLILLSFTGVILSSLWPLFVYWFYNVFSVQWIWASAVFLCIGGGSQVLSALLLSTVVDVTPRHLTTTVIYLVNGAELVTQFVSPPIGAALMEKNVWLPYAVSLPIILLSFPVLLAMPESLVPATRTKRSPADMTGSDEEHGEPEITVKSVRVTLSTIQVKLWNLLQIPPVRISLALGFVGALAFQSNSILLQFASKRLHWSLAHASYLLSVRAAVALCLTLGLLPSTTYYLTRRLHIQPLRVDVFILRVSLVALSIGAFLIGVSLKPWLLILGFNLISAPLTFNFSLIPLIQLLFSLLGCVVCASGGNALQTLQGIGSSFIDQSNTAEFYSTLAFMELVGIMIGGPIGAAAFKAGMALGPSEDSLWAGLPFYISAFLITIALALSFAFRVRRTT